MHRRLIPFVLVLAAGALIATGATAAPNAKEKNGFRQALAAKLGAQLDKPAADVAAALKTTAKANRPSAEERAKRKAARAKGERPSREQRRTRAAAAKKAWTASMAKELRVEPEAVTAAVRALVKERLDSLVEDGWLTAEQRDKRLRGDKLGVAFLRVGGR